MITDRLREMCDRRNDAIALHVGDRAISRRELSSLATDIVAAIDRDAGKHEAVAFVVRNRPAHVAALFGLIAAGRPIRFVNGFQSPEKIARDIAALAARIVVADEEDWAMPDLGTHPGMAIRLREGACAVTTGGARKVGPSLPGVAVELLTSGTTGPPTRVRLSAAQLTAALDDQAQIAAEMGEAQPSAAPEAALIQYAPILHIAGLWTALQAGADGRRLVLLEKFDADRWIEAVRTLRPTMAGMSPPLLRMVLDRDPPREALASLVAIRCGSTALDGDTRAAFEQRYAIPLLGVYGATEYAGVVASWSLADHRRFGAEKASSAGRLRRQVAAARVVDPETGRSLATGQTGLLELRVPRMGEGWMRSSDLASIDAEGFLTLHGRADSAIVRGGFKILPDQLVAILRRHPAVADAAVVGMPDRRLGQVPVAAVELLEGAIVEAADLDRHMRTELPAYQVPARYRIIDALPRTPAAKVRLGAVAALFAGDDPPAQ